MRELMGKIIQHGVAVMTTFLKQALLHAKVQTNDLNVLLETSTSPRIQTLPKFLRTAVAILQVVESGDTKKAHGMLFEFLRTERDLMGDIMSVRDPNIRSKIEPTDNGR